MSFANASLPKSRRRPPLSLSLPGNVLMGDFSELERIAEQQRLFEQEQLEKALPMEQTRRGCRRVRGGAWFKRGDYAKVVELLEPHLPYLSPRSESGMRSRRWRLARSRNSSYSLSVRFALPGDSAAPQKSGFSAIGMR